MQWGVTSPVGLFPFRLSSLWSKLKWDGNIKGRKIKTQKDRPVNNEIWHKYKLIMTDVPEAGQQSQYLKKMSCY